MSNPGFPLALAFQEYEQNFRYIQSVFQTREVIEFDQIRATNRTMRTIFLKNTLGNPVGFVTTTVFYYSGLLGYLRLLLYVQ